VIKEFFRGSIIYIIGSFITRGISFILLPFYTRYLTPADYGIVDFYNILMVIIIIGVSLEITQSVARFYPEAGDLEKKQYATTSFYFTFFAFITFLIITILFSHPVAKVLIDKNADLKVFDLAMLNIALAGMFYFLQNQLKWSIKTKLFALTSIVQATIAAVVSIILVLTMDSKVEAVILGQIVANLLGSILCFSLTKDDYVVQFKWDKLKELLRFSLPLVPSSIAVWVSLYIDKLVIKEYLGFDSLGIYGVAFKFASVVGILMLGIHSSLTPLIYKYYKLSDTPAKIEKLFNIFCFVTFSLIMGMSLFLPDIIYWLIPKQFAFPQILVLILSISIMLGNLYLFTPGLSIMKKTKIIAIISISNAIINTGLNILLVKYYGVIGSATATLISCFITFSLYVIIGNSYYKISINLLKLGIIIISQVGIMYVINEVIYKVTILNGIIKALIMLIIAYMLYKIFDINKNKSMEIK
jgi:O-antigen/teichoic acid export membrane protein